MPTNPWALINSALLEDPEAVIRGSQESQAVRDALLANAVSDRYGGDWKQSASGLSDDMGLGPYKIPVHTNSTNLKANTFGQFDPDTRSIGINPRVAASDDAKLATLAHELGHARDQVAAPGYHGNTPGTHHRDFADFDPEMAITLRAQSALEHGVPVGKQVLSRYPWLKNVTPESSNKLANPWSSARKISPEEWNLLR